MRIDSHQHFWRLDRGDYTWLTSDLSPIYRDFGPEDLRPLLDRHDIAGTVLVQAAATVAETDYMLSLAADCDFIRGVVGWVDFEAPDAVAEIARLAADPKLKSFRPMIQDIADPSWMLRPSLQPAMRAVEVAALAFDALLKPQHLAPFQQFLKLYPKLRIVIDHGAKPDIAAGAFADWAVGMRAIAADPRVVCKLSGLVTEARPDWQAVELRRYLDLLLASFGADRLMWGSDWPVVNLAGGYDRWRQVTMDYVAELSEAEQDAILGGTASAFYRL